MRSVHWKYATYLARHKWFVFVAGRRTRAPAWRLLIHDWSKCLPQEWRPYATFFYAPKPTGMPVDTLGRPSVEANIQTTLASRKAAFDRAWLHHQHWNKHHHQHWRLVGDDGVTVMLPMPECYAREMVADWAGAGRAITGKWETRTWYERNREHILLHPDTADWVETCLQLLEARRAR